VSGRKLRWPQFEDGDIKPKETVILCGRACRTYEIESISDNGLVHLVDMDNYRGQVGAGIAPAKVRVTFRVVTVDTLKAKYAPFHRLEPHRRASIMRAWSGRSR
jgi:hypothetical protein